MAYLFGALFVLYILWDQFPTLFGVLIIILVIIATLTGLYILNEYFILSAARQ